MLKNLLLVLTGIVLGLTLINLCFAEKLTITTYYPSPYGVYKKLLATSLGLGDTNGDGNIDSSDVPTTQGQLHAQDLIRSNTGFQASGTNGITAINKAVQVGCTITVKGGLITGGSCFN